MPLTINNTYQNVGFDYILDGLRDILIAEFAYGDIYISPVMKGIDPFQVKLWITNSTTEEHTAQSWTKSYTVSIELFMIDAHPDENSYKQLHQDTERIYQSLFNNSHKEITVASNALQWYNGRADTITINDFEEDEASVEGLLKSTISFTCFISRQ